ncbi:MAG: PQQ-dependent sugar dehydrogenase [Deltaproteobacteria bacterium]|nr:PQQ-dependent sugar dehydrogenase [Deltaproteobacteria bacterium]
MLRIDVSVPDGDAWGYRVPADNPFVGSSLTGVRTEIWAFGMRNPWRWSFDPPALGGTGALIIGDVGENGREEIDYEPAGRGGRNYGWRIREGTNAFDASQAAAFLPFVDPIFEYAHDIGFSLTGGYIYRGTALGPDYRGRYFVGDWVTKRVWSIALAVNPATQAATASDFQDHTDALGGSARLGNVTSFGTDARGELYIVSYFSGREFFRRSH